VVVTALGFFLWYSAVRRLGVERAGLFAGLVPVAALVTSAAVGAAAFTLGRLAGAVAVGAGIALGMKRSPEQSVPAPTSPTSASLTGRARLVREARLARRHHRRRTTVRARRAAVPGRCLARPGPAHRARSA
jgi:EamA-like transporter family